MADLTASYLRLIALTAVVVFLIVLAALLEVGNRRRGRYGAATWAYALIAPLATVVLLGIVLGLPLESFLFMLGAIAVYYAGLGIGFLFVRRRGLANKRINQRQEREVD